MPSSRGWALREPPAIMLLLKLLPIDGSVAAENMSVRPCLRQAREAPAIMLLLKLFPLDWSFAAENMPVRPRTRKALREPPAIMLSLKLLSIDWSVAAENIPVRPRTPQALREPRAIRLLLKLLPNGCCCKRLQQSPAAADSSAAEELPRSLFDVLLQCQTGLSDFVSLAFSFSVALHVRPRTREARSDRPLRRVPVVSAITDVSSQSAINSTTLL